MALCLPVLRSFWKGRGFHSILFCTLFQLCTEGKEVLLKNPTLPRRQPVGFSNEGVRDGELRGHILLSHNTNITSFLLSRLKEEMRGGRGARGLRQEASLSAAGVGGGGSGPGLARARLEPSALGFGRSSFSAPGGDKGRPPSAPPSSTVVPCNLRPRAPADLPASSPQRRAW